MNAKTIAICGLKVIALAVIMFVCFIVATIISGVSTPSASGRPPVDERAALPILLLVSLLQAAVLAYLILRSRWSGWKLIGAVFLAFYGLSTIVTQIESVVYLPTQLPPGLIPKLFVMGAITAALFSPVSVLIMGKFRQTLTQSGPNLRLVMPALDVSLPGPTGNAVDGVCSAHNSHAQGPVMGGRISSGFVVCCLEQPAPSPESIYARSRRTYSSCGNRIVKFPAWLLYRLADVSASFISTRLVWSSNALILDDLRRGTHGPT